MIRRPPRSTQSRSSAASDVYKRQTLDNLAARNIRTGFGFLAKEASFEISEKLIAYDASDTYARAFLVGLGNTLMVAVLGVLFATALGTVVGIARLSSNWLVARLASALSLIHISRCPRPTLRKSRG